jgi:hypothetical protein
LEVGSGDVRASGNEQETDGAKDTDEDEDACKLAEEARDVGFDGERFKVDDAEEELFVEDAELQGQAVGEAAEWARHG